MDIDQIRTFLVVAANGCFLEAASRLHLTQSTVSTRKQRLVASYLGDTLFVRNRFGTALTAPRAAFFAQAYGIASTRQFA